MREERGRGDGQGIGVKRITVRVNTLDQQQSKRTTDDRGRGGFEKELPLPVGRHGGITRMCVFSEGVKHALLQAVRRTTRRHELHLDEPCSVCTTQGESVRC